MAATMAHCKVESSLVLGLVYTKLEWLNTVYVLVSHCYLPCIRQHFNLSTAIHTFIQGTINIIYNYRYE